MGSWQKAVLLKGSTGPRGSLLYNDTYPPDSIYTQKATIGDYYLNTTTNTMYEYTSNISIAVGSNGQSNVSIAISSNGLNWIAADNNPFNNGQANAIEFNTSNLWVAVGKDSSNIVSIATSSNGYTWSPSLTNPFEGGEGSDVAWNGSLWVAVGKNSNSSVTVATSPNGYIWTAINTFEGQGIGIAWNGSQWVVVGQSSESSIIVGRSEDGFLWQLSLSTPFPEGFVYGIAWNRSLWVAVGGNSSVTIATSPDSEAWTDSENPFPGGAAIGISYNSSYWVAVGTNSNSSVTIARSSDAVVWTPSTNPFTGGYGSKVSWSGSNWLAVGKNSNGSVTVAISDDGLVWTPTTNPFTDGSAYGIVSGGKWTQITSLGTNIYSGISVPESNDLPKKLGDFYINTTTNTLYKYQLGTLSLIVGYDSTSEQSIATSLDGSTWTYSVTNPFTNARAIAWNGSYLCAVGDTAAISLDGSNWSPTTNPFSNGNGIAWNGSYWLAVGYNGTTTAATSLDTSVWTPSDPFPGGVGYGIGTNGSHWCAVGSNSDSTVTVATGTDGSTWTPADVFTGGVGKGIAWNGSYWCAVGSNYYESVEIGGGVNVSVTAATSPDGITWSNIDVFTGGIGNGIAWNGSYWCAVGVHGSQPITAYISSNGSTWIPSNPFSGEGYGISWNGSLWFAIGIHSNVSTVATSPDGSNWTRNEFILETPAAILHNTVQTNIWNPIATFGSGSGSASNSLVISSSYPSNPYIGEYYLDTTTNNLYKYGYIDPKLFYLTVGNANIFTSSDGSNWTNVNYSINANAIAYNGSLWIIVGGSIITSSDGSNWTPSFTQPFISGNAYGIAWNGSYWVAVGDNNSNATSFTSTDGSIWTASLTNPYTTVDGFERMYGIAWNGSYWLEVGITTDGSVSIATSPDGSTWTASSNPFPSILDDKGGIVPGFGRAVSWNGSYWIVVGSSGDNSVTAAISSNGSDWSTANPFAEGTGYAIAWNGSNWCAVGTGSSASAGISSDGFGWSSSDPFAGGTGYGIIWNGSLWIAVGRSSDASISIVYSPDGLTWSSSSNIFSGEEGKAIAYSSQNGYNGWSLTTTLGAKGASGIRVASNYPSTPYVGEYYLDTITNGLYQYNYNISQALYLTVGYNLDRTITISKSYSGTSWVPTNTTPFPNGEVRGIAYNGSLWLAVGYNNTSITLSRSSNGDNWINSTFTEDPFKTGEGNGIAWNGSLWVIVGLGSNGITISSSSNGFAWTDSINNPFTGGLGRAIAYGSNLWMAVGNNGDNTVSGASSSDGSNWTTSDPFPGGVGRGIAWNGFNWMAVGNNSDNTASAAISSDGSIWTPSDPFPGGTGYGIAWNGSNWMAVGLTGDSTATAATSPDGSNWISSDPFPGGSGFGIIWNGSTWIAVGTNSDSTIVYSISANGSNWFPSQTHTLIGGIGFGIAYIPPTSSLAWNFITSLGSKSFTIDSIYPSNPSVGQYYLDTITNRLYQYATSIYQPFYLAVGIGSFISSDGTTWNSQGDPMNGGTTYAIAYNGKDLWVAGGYGFAAGNSNLGTLTIATSPDGSNWTPATNLFPGGTVFGVAYGNLNGPLWIATGASYDGSVGIIRSQDGITWVASSTTFPNGGLAIAVNSFYWIVCGTGSTPLYTSTNGLTWTPAVTYTFNGIIRSLVYATTPQNIWVGVGYTSDFSATAATSTDGLNWSASGNPFPGGSGYGVAWNGSLFVAVGENSNKSITIASSPDGVSWTPANNDPFSDGIAGNSNVCANGITYNGSLWVAVGANSNFSVTAATSHDGMNWSVSLKNPSSNVNGVAFGIKNVVGSLSWKLITTLGSTVGLQGPKGKEGVQGSQGPQGFQGEMGSQGFQGDPGSIGLNIASNFPLNPSLSNYHLDTSTNILYQYRYVKGGLLAVLGRNSTNTASVSISTDGSNWNPSANNPFPNFNNAFGIVHNGSYWLVGGQDSSLGISKSFNGSTWTNSGNPFTGPVYALAWNGTYWCVVGQGYYTASTSSNGSTWISLGRPFINGQGTGIAWNGSYWCAVGYNDDRSITISTSSNGVDWTSSESPFVGGQGRGIAWNGSVWVAVGNNSNGTVTAAVSENGSNWTSTNPFPGQEGRGIAWNGSLWVAVGRNTGSSITIVSSTDGSNWTSSVNNPFTIGFGSGVVWDGSNWIVVGISSASSVSARSSNGSNWTISGSPFPSSTIINGIGYTNSNDFLVWDPVTGLGKGEGNIIIVDSIYGNDSLGVLGVSPFATLQAALSNASIGKIIYIYPGTYTLYSGITMPNGVSICGISRERVIIQIINVTADTTLLTMNESPCVENITFLLTSSGHSTLKGVVFGGTSSVSSKLRNCSITVYNLLASSEGTSTVTGVEFNGTGSLTPDSFSFNCLEDCTIKVYSNGGGNKRGILVSNTNIVTARDINVFVSGPFAGTSTGSYVGVETNDANSLGSIQLRSASIGTVAPTSGQTFTSSDILQTTPATITNPTYLASAGIQIGPGTDLVTKRAGGLPFSTYNYPTIIYYGLKGDIKNATSGWLWPGTQAIGASFPDSATPAAYFRAQQPCIICGLAASLTGAPGTGHSVTLLVEVTPSGGSKASTTLTLTFGATDTNKTYYATTHSVNTGDRIHLYLSYTGNNDNTAHDLTCQIDLF
jgi:hypothetical protein